MSGIPSAAEDWVEPLPPKKTLLRRRHTDVSQDPRYTRVKPGPRQWRQEEYRHELQHEHDREYGVYCGSFSHPRLDSPARDPRLPIQQGPRNHPRPRDLIYATGVPDTPNPIPSTFDRKKCNLILIEIGFCRDFACIARLQEKTTKYAPLVTALQTIWGKVMFVAVPVGHAGTTLAATPLSLAQALLATRREMEQARAKRNVIIPYTDSAARSHDSYLL